MREKRKIIYRGINAEIQRDAKVLESLGFNTIVQPTKGIGSMGYLTWGWGGLNGHLRYFLADNGVLVRTDLIKEYLNIFAATKAWIKEEMGDELAKMAFLEKLGDIKRKQTT